MVRIIANLELERIRVIGNGLAVHFVEIFLFSIPFLLLSRQVDNTIDFL